MTGYASSVCCSRPMADQLVDVAAHLGDRGAGQQAERAQLVVPARDHLRRWRVRAGRWPRAWRRSAGPRARRTRGSCAPAPPGRPRLEFAQAVVAGAAAVRRVAVAEVLREMPVPAADARRVALHLPEQRLARVVQLAVSLEHQPPPHEVGGGVDQQAFGLEAVAAGSSRLLLVVLERSRRARVHDEAHVRSVDAHAECHRRHDDVDALAEERILVAASARRRRARRGRAAPARRSHVSHAASASTSRREVQ